MLLNDSVLNLLGLASRARKLATGETVVHKIRKKSCTLVLICEDASEATKKMLIDKCTFYQIDYLLVENSELLSKAIGKSNRKYIAILDEGFAKGIKKKLG